MNPLYKPENLFPGQIVTARGIEFLVINGSDITQTYWDLHETAYFADGGTPDVKGNAHSGNTKPGTLYGNRLIFVVLADHNPLGPEFGEVCL